MMMKQQQQQQHEQKICYHRRESSSSRKAIRRVLLVGTVISSYCWLLLATRTSHAFTPLTPIFPAATSTTFPRKTIVRTITNEHKSSSFGNRAIRTIVFQSSRVTTNDEVVRKNVVVSLDRFVALNTIWDIVDASSTAITRTTTSMIPTTTREGVLVQEQQQQHTKLASMPTLMINLIKQIVGGGVFALPASVAAIGTAAAASGDHGDGNIIPMACGIIAFMGLLNAYFFSLCGRVCSWTGATSFKQAWEETVGPDSSQYVSIILAMKTTLSCVVYAMMLGDSFASLANGAGFYDHIITRTEALEVLGLTVLLPICLKKDLSSLAPFSLVGLAMILFTASTVVVRSLDGTYAVANDVLQNTALEPTFASAATTTAATTALQPAFEAAAATIASSTTGLAFPDELQGMVLLGCTLISTFVAHYNAPRFHAELANNTPQRFNIVTGTSYGVATVVFMAVAAAGYTTFGSAALPFVLNNYSPNDTIISLGNALVAISICLTFPLPFVGLRDGCFDAMQIPVEQRTPTVSAAASVGLLTMVIALASCVSDLGAVLSIGGGTFSTAVAAVLPTLMFRAAVEKKYGSNKMDENQISISTDNNNGDDIYPRQKPLFMPNIDFNDANRNKIESNIALGLMSVCVALGGTGVTIAMHKMLS